MSDATDEAIQTEPQAYPETVPDAEEHAHPSDITYIQVAIGLALLTTLEVLTYPFDFGDFAIPVLMVCMIAKFTIVVAYFMHLKFDSRLFRRLFVAGLVTAVAVYVAALSMFHFWTE
jgi:cytochrome c oxidase subunit IV